MESPWTCIVFTCSNVTWSRVLFKALTDLKNRNSLLCVTKETVILPVTDPEPNIGSGAATLNALYVVTEYLSAQKDFTVVTSDVLQNANILILHHGRNYVYDIGGKGLISIPRCKISGYENDFDLQSNLEHLVYLMSQLKSKCKCTGIWVCGTDASFISYNTDMALKVPQATFQHCTMFCVSSDITYAARHGVVVSDTEGTVQHISYCASEEYLRTVASDDHVQVISGIVYFPVSVAEKLLYFHTVAPLNCCTYMGIDAGSEPLKLSLFFDILVAMIKNISKEDYSSGHYSNLYNVKTGLDSQSQNALYNARNIIWSYLSQFTLRAATLCNLKHCYWDERLTAQHHMQNIFSFGKTGKLQSHILCGNLGTFSKALAINTLVDCHSFSMGGNSLVCNSKIQGGEISIGSNCFLSDVDINIPKSMLFVLPDNLCVLNFEQNNVPNKKVTVVFGVQDELHKNVDIELDSFCGLPWDQLLKVSGLSSSDLWKDEPKTLFCAKLFPCSFDITFYINTFLGNYDELLKTNWKELPRFSIKDLLRDTNIEKDVLWRQNIKRDVICLQIAESIEENRSKSFLPIFKLACSEEWHLKVLETLDTVAEKLQNKNFELCRTLSCIADLLGTMAGTMGRVRSGPGNNKAWITAFDFLRKSEPGRAVSALKEMRNKWLNSNLIIRAARHYESALQIFVQNAVKSARTFVNLDSSTLPAIGQWVTAECPARVDLQGGWSDTPPICYEQGGSVVNIAVLIDNKKPIGAKVKRTDTLTIRFKVQNLHTESELEIKSLADLSDFNQVYANSALLKAAVVCAELVDLSSDKSLQEQLERFQGGFELCVWSFLPQGTGLGTSSILAGAIIAVLWTASGRTYTKSCILHAVLYLEQLLTTGGGWQDQVGGIMGGVNRGYSEDTLPLEIKVERIPVNESFVNLLNKHLFLIYTGKVRLAKNLLQNVIRNWYARDEDIVKCFKELVVNSHKTAEAFRNEDIKEIGEQMNRYWAQKKILASGCEPVEVKQLMDHLDIWTYGQLLVGAGGGGFMCILTKQPSTSQEINSKIQQLPFARNISVHSATIDMVGLTVHINGAALNVK